MMKIQWDDKLHRELGWWLCVVLMVGLFFSRALMSLSMISLISVAILNRNVAQNFSRFFKSPVLVLLTGLWLVVVLSGLWSADNIPYWLERVRVKLPFLVLPFAFFSLPSFSERRFRLLLWLFVAMIMAGAIWSMAHLVTDYDQIVQGYSKAWVLPTPFEDHIRFSLSVAIASLFCMYLFYAYRQSASKLKYLAAVCFVLLAAYLHILSVRTGLLALYIVLLMGIVRIIVVQKKWGLGLLLLLLLAVMPFGAYHYIDSFHNKVDYFFYDFSQRNSSEVQHLSDSGRWVSWKLGLLVMKAHPLLGVGAGNIMDVMNQMYAQYYPGIPPENRLVPHNEFLLMGVATGIPGLLYLLVTFISPLFDSRYRKHFYLLAFIAICGLGMLVEPMLEIQYGICIYLFFLLLWMHHIGFSKKIPS